MKKLYVSLFSLAIAFGANAQSASMSVGKTRSLAKPSGLNQPVSSPALLASGDTIWENDFSNASDWDIANSIGNNSDWVIGTDVPAGDFPIEGILSTSAANGYALFDSDLYCTTGDDATVTMANPVDLTGYAAVVVQFQQHYRNYQGATYLEVSTDGSAWTQFVLNGSLAGNAATSNPDFAQVNISGVAGGQATVWLRFRYVGACDYSWMVDDVAIVEGADNDIQLVDLWHGDFQNAWEYQEVPLAQAQEVTIGAASLNQGGNSQTVVTYNYDITLNGTSVNSGSFAANSPSLASSESDTTFYATGFTPSALGQYMLMVSVSSAETDGNPANNEGMSNFAITEFIYAHDDIDNIEFQISGGDDVNASANEYKAGMYYEVVADGTIHSVQAAFGVNTTTTACFVEIFDAADLTTALVTEVYDFQPGDISSGASIVLVDILLDGGAGLAVTAGTTYLISIGNTGAGEQLWILASDGDDDRGQLRYGPFGAGGAVDWYTGYTNSIVVRANFSPSVGISENQDLTAIEMFPNPANDVLTVKFNANESNDIRVNVIGMDGKMVYSQSVNAFSGQFTSRISLEGIANGLYSVQVISDNATYTQKVAVVK